MGRLSLQMLGYHFCNPQPAVSAGQSAAHRLHGNGMKLVLARISVGILIGPRNRSERLFGLLQPVRKQDRFKLPRRLLDFGSVPRVRVLQIVCRLRPAYF